MCLCVCVCESHQILRRIIPTIHRTTPRRVQRRSNSPKFGQPLANLWPTNLMANVWSSFGRLRQDLVGSVPYWPELGRSSVEVAQIWPHFGLIWTKLSRHRKHLVGPIANWAELGRAEGNIVRIWPNLGLIWSKLGRHRQNLGGSVPNWAGIGRNAVGLVQIWFHFGLAWSGRCRHNLAESVPNCAELGRNSAGLANKWHTFAIFCRTRAKLGRSCHKLAYICPILPNSEEIQSNLPECVTLVLDFGPNSVDLAKIWPSPLKLGRSRTGFGRTRSLLAKRWLAVLQIRPGSQVLSTSSEIGRVRANMADIGRISVALAQIWAKHEFGRALSSVM